MKAIDRLMMEERWVACTDPRKVLVYEWIREEGRRRRVRVGSRKRRLFVASCCRDIWPLLKDRQREAVEMAERFADGLATKKGMREAGAQAELDYSRPSSA